MQAADNEIIITRLIHAPRERVWEAWTVPEQLEKWWGPDGFTVTTKEIDIREGGEWRFTMHGPDGRDYPNNIVFTEIRKPELIAHDHGGDDGKVHFKATITFEEQDGGTFITMRSVFPSKEERDMVVRDYGAIEGGQQTIGRLAAFVEKS
jgi:uncharacterized protein YndB with AHSA1/START domain